MVIRLRAKYENSCMAVGSNNYETSVFEICFDFDKRVRGSRKSVMIVGALLEGCTMYKRVTRVE